MTDKMTSGQPQSVKRLSKSNSLDAELVSILKAILQDVENSVSENLYVVIGKLIVQKVSRLSSVKVKEKSILTTLGVSKTIKEYSLDLMLEILIMMSG